MTLYRQKSFTVPTIEHRSKTPCKVHHFVRGECMRCNERIGPQREQMADANAPHNRKTPNGDRE